MSISYNLDIPDGPNNPSNDQPKMKVNTNAVNSWTAVDHVEFSSAPSGTHKQITFSSKNAPAAQTDPQSVLYTDNGVEFSNIAQLWYTNQSGDFPLSIIRAFGAFVLTNGNTTLINGYNCTLQSSSSTTAVILLTSGVTTGTNFVVIPTINNTSSLAYTISSSMGSTTITFVKGIGVVNPIVSFAVLQI
jgi:hypothetical protein